MWRAARAAEPADVTDSWRGPERDVEPGDGDSWRVQSGAVATAGLFPWEQRILVVEGVDGKVLQRYAVTALTNETAASWGIMANPTAQWAMVTLPAAPCFGCTLRLTHQALAAAEEPYVRWSCADVTVVTAGSNACHGCSGGIAPCALSLLSDSWQCACPAQVPYPPTALPYTRSYCERKDECMVDSDCGVNAKCIDILSSNYPTSIPLSRHFLYPLVFISIYPNLILSPSHPLSISPPHRQCFCAEGWMGPQCAQRSPLSLDAAVDTTSWWKEYPFNLTIPITTTTATTINTVTNASAGGLMTPTISASSAASAGVGAVGDGAVAGGGVRYMTIWWKILKDDAPDASLPGGSNLASFGPQVEMAIAAPTTSYVAIGWRPANLPWVPPPNINPSRATPFPPSPPSPPPPSPSPPPPVPRPSPPPPPALPPPAPLRTPTGRRNRRSPPGEERRNGGGAQERRGRGEERRDGGDGEDERRVGGGARGERRGGGGAEEERQGGAGRRERNREPQEGRDGRRSGEGSNARSEPQTESQSDSRDFSGRESASSRRRSGGSSNRAGDNSADGNAANADVAEADAAGGDTAADGSGSNARGPPSIVVERQHRVPVREASAGAMPAMFQQDMTIVTARGGYYRIQDAWTFSTHGMPIADTAMGGTDDITAATAHEDAASGTTYVKFRRPLLPSDDSFDHAITDNDFTLVWALGQPSPASPSTSPLLSAASASTTQTLSTLPSSSTSASLPPLVQQQIAAFFRADELKYHGGSTSSRGSFPRINLFLGSDPLNSRLCQPSPLPGFSCSLALQGDRYVVLADVSQASAGVSRVTPYSRATATSTAAAAGASAGGGARTTVGGAAVGASSGGAGAAGNPVVRSFILVNHTAQGLQSSNRLEFTNASVTLVNGSALLSFSRPYTQRNGALNISLGADERSHLVWAFAPNAFSSSGGSGSPPNHYLQHRGSLWLNWASGEAQVQASPFPWLIAHSSIMAFVFCFLLPLSAVAARLLAVRPDSNRPVFHPLHVLSALLTPLLLVPALAFAIHAASFFRTNAALLLSIAPSAPHRLAALLTPHGLLGGTLVLFLVIEVICALLCRPSPGSPGHAWWMLLHRVLGVGLLLGGAANVALGALQLAMLLGQPLWLCVGVPLLPWALLSLLYLLLQLARPTPAAPPKLQAEDFDVLAAAMRTKVTGFKGAGAAGANGGAVQGEGVSGGVVGGLEEWPPAGVKWPTARRSAPGTPSGPQRQQQSPTRSFGSVSELGSTTDSSPPQREPLYGRPFISHSSGESSSSGGEQRRWQGVRRGGRRAWQRGQEMVETSPWEVHEEARKLAAPEIHTRLLRVSGAEVAGRSGRHGGREHCLCLSLCHPCHPCIPASPAVAANSASLAVLACLASSADSSLDVAQSHASISPSMASATPSDGLAQSPPPPAAEFTADPATSVAEAGATWQAEASSQTRSQSPSAELARQSQGPVETPAQDPGAAGKGEGGEIPAGDSSGVDEIPADGGVPSAAAPTPAAPAAPAASAAPAAPAAPAPPAAPAVGEEQSTGGSVGTPAAATTAGSSRGLNAAAPAFVPQFACAGVGAGADVAWLPAHLLPPQPLLPLPFNTPGAAQQGVAGAPFAWYGGGIPAHALAQGVGGGWGDVGWEAGGVWGAQDAVGAMWGSGADSGRREGRADGMAGGGGAGGTARVEFYFSDHNMPYDHHLLSMANQDPQGFVSLWYLAQFREVRSMLHPSMSTAPGPIVALLADAIREASSSTTLVLSDDGMRVRRQQPLPFTDVDELQARTVVAHNLPPNISLSAIEDIFKQAGRVRMVRLCTPQASGHTASAVAHVRVAAATAPSTAAAAAAAAPSNADAPSAAAAPAAADAPSAAAAAAPSAAADLVTGPSNSHGEASSCAKFHALIEFETVKEAHNAVETLNSSDWRHGLHVKLFKKLTKKQLMQQQQELQQQLQKQQEQWQQEQWQQEQNKLNQQQEHWQQEQIKVKQHQAQVRHERQQRRQQQQQQQQQQDQQRQGQHAEAAGKGRKSAGMAGVPGDTGDRGGSGMERIDKSSRRGGEGGHALATGNENKACSGDPLCDSCAAAPAASPTAHGKKSRAGKGRGRGGEGGGNKHGAAGGAGGAAAGRGGAGGVGSKGSAPGAAAAAAGGSGGGGGSSGGGGEAVGSKPLPGPRGPDGSRGFSLGRGKRMPGS
ncbi:unnamed protein product [Closterium sp. NIES-64]|nr:unnamed protein product [Closterium sp. NIES-64]